MGNVFSSNNVAPTDKDVSKVLLSTGDTLWQALDFLPLLMQTVEKAASQGTQVPTVTEGVAAALLLSKLSVADAQAGKGLWVCRDLGGRGSLHSPCSFSFRADCCLQE